MTAVTVLWLPSGRVVVARTTEVLEVRRVLRVVAVAAPEGDPPLLDLEMVTYPPPMVETIVKPSGLVVVMTWPSVKVAVTARPSALVVVMTWPSVKDGTESGAEGVASGVDGVLSSPSVVVGESLGLVGTSGDVLVEVVVSGGPLGESSTVVVGVVGVSGFSRELPSTGSTGLGTATGGVVGDCSTSPGLSTGGVVG